MALTLGPNGLTMADGSTITMGGQPRSIRWTSTADNITQTSNGNGDVYMNLELTMPAAVDNDSIYLLYGCLLYTSPSPRDLSTSRMPSSA